MAKGTISTMSCDIMSNGFQPVSDYIIGPGGEQLTETGSDGQGNMVWSHTNVFAGGSLIGTYDKDGLHFYLNDWLGNRRVQTDYAGVFEQSCTNLPFGDSLNCTASLVSPTEHHFTGKEWDAETGNDYFGARYYASATGRFLTPDWSAKVEPVPYAKLDNPQSLDLYGYVWNSPLTRTDPTGHYTCADGKGHTIKCGQDIQNWLGLIQKAADTYASGSKERTQLEKVIGFYGKANTKNNVIVKFGSADGNPGSTKAGNGVTTITLDTKVMSESFGKSKNPEAEKAATVAHEGKHGVDLNGRGKKFSTTGDFLEERRAFTTQSYVNEGLNADSVYEVWTQSKGFSQETADAWALQEALDCQAKGDCK